MSLPQHTWDVIRTDIRFIAAGPVAQELFIRAARTATWNMGREYSRKAETIFRKALDDAFGAHPYAMQPETIVRRRYAR